jgi:hypothetical protein
MKSAFIKRPQPLVSKYFIPIAARDRLRLTRRSIEGRPRDPEAAARQRQLPTTRNHGQAGMNRYQDAIQSAIARLGDHVGASQLLMRNLAECRELADGEIDPETALAIECWIEQAADLMGEARDRYRKLIRQEPQT